MKKIWINVVLIVATAYLCYRVARAMFIQLINTFLDAVGLGK